MKKENPSTYPHYQDSASSSSATRSFSTVSNSLFSSQKRGLKLFTTRRKPKVVSRVGRRKQGCLEAFALPLGMSFAAIVDKVLERKGAVEDKLLVDHLSQICASAIRESLVNVFGDKFDSFVENFEKSFRSTLMTLQSINKSTKVTGRRNRKLQRGEYSTDGATMSSFNILDNSANDFVTEECCSETLPQTSTRDEQVTTYEDRHDNCMIDLRNQQLILHDRQIMQQLPFVSPSRSSDAFDSSKYMAISSILKKSVMEQARSNDLKTFKMGLEMRKIQQKERELTLSSDSNFLERCKLSLGFSKTSFKFEMFKTRVEDIRYAELLKRCIDCLVSGVFVMFASVAYGVFIFSYQRITEVTEACTSIEESKSWWMPKAMTSFNFGMQILKCQFQVLTRMFAGGFMICTIAYMLSRRSVTSGQTMPVTMLILLLGVLCGISGKLCIDTLGGDGSCWLLFWWTFCSTHIFSNIWTSTLFVILNGPVTVSEEIKNDPLVPYWCRRWLFYTTAVLFLPLLCGLLPFASLSEWRDHFSSLIMNQLISGTDD